MKTFFFRLSRFFAVITGVWVCFFALLFLFFLTTGAWTGELTVENAVESILGFFVLTAPPVIFCMTFNWLALGTLRFWVKNKNKRKTKTKIERRQDKFLKLF